MKRIIFTVLFLLIALQSNAETSSFVKRAENSLNKFKTVEGMFTQYNPDNTIYTGEFWIQKPGKMRFDYVYPNKNFMVSNGSFVFYWDEELQQQTNIPLSYTPAGIILNKDIKFGKEIKVKNVQETENAFSLDLCYAENEDMGFVSLKFNKKDDSLIQWQVKELNGNTTVIVIEDVKFNVDIEKEKFNFKDPRHNPFKLN